MPTALSALRRPKALLLATALSALAAATASADTAAVPGAPAPDRTQNVTINLIKRLVQRGVLTQQDADELIRMAEEDAAAASAQVAAARPAAGEAPAPEGTVRVTYVPEVVKQQLREQIKDEVMAQARAENWADPHALPEWATRFRFFGDIRVRYEGLFFGKENDNTGAAINFPAINAGVGFDINPNTSTTPLPYYDVDKDRNRFRLRTRFGAEIDMGDGFTAGVRLATGDSNSPVTTNQSLGAAGGFSKYAVWLDRAFIRYQPDEDQSYYIGRFDNPFLSTPILFDEDLGFDGIAATTKFDLAAFARGFVTAGAFPIYNTDLNFSSIQPDKSDSADRYLLGAQLGTNWKLGDKLALTFAASYYDFTSVAGRLSSPTLGTAFLPGDTDAYRPAFAQKGNTYMALRDISEILASPATPVPQYQYFGLASEFRELVATAKLDYDKFEPMRLTFTGEIVKNLAFDRDAISSIAVNNLGGTNGNVFVGGDLGWMLQIKAGHPALQQRWDWNASLAYSYVESDAVVDGFTDSDLGGGGTNLKGFSLSASLALSPRTWLNLRWMSGREIAGPTFKNDTLQFDFNGKF